MRPACGSPTRIRCSRPSPRRTPPRWRPAICWAIPASSATRSTPAFPVPGAGDSLTPFLESDPVLGEVDAHFAGNYLNEETILRAARAKGLSTASIGKLGPALIFDHTERTGQQTILVDDSTGRPGGIPLSDELQAASRRGRPAGPGARRAAPTARPGPRPTPGTLVANVEQQAYFADVATKAVLPLFKARGQAVRAGVLVARSGRHAAQPGRQPGAAGAGHQRSDRLRRDPQRRRRTWPRCSPRCSEQGLTRHTDVILTSDHGFSTISKESATSFAATQSLQGRAGGPAAAGLRRHRPRARARPAACSIPTRRAPRSRPDAFPSRANGLIGTDPAKPDVVVAANGGSDLVYLPSGDKALARRWSRLCRGQDYVSGLFVDDALGPIPGTLPLSAIALDGTARDADAGDRGQLPQLLDRLRRSDDLRRRGRRYGAAAGPGHARQLLARRYPQHHGRRSGRASGRASTSPAPASNADLGKTIARLLGLTIPDKGKLVGRVLTEAMPNGAHAEPSRRRCCARSPTPPATSRCCVSDRRPDPLLRCRRLSRPHARPRRSGPLGRGGGALSVAPPASASVVRPDRVATAEEAIPRPAS